MAPRFESVGWEGRRWRGAPPDASGRRRSIRVQDAKRGGWATSGGRDMAERARRAWAAHIVRGGGGRLGLVILGSHEKISYVGINTDGQFFQTSSTGYIAKLLI